MTPRSPTHTSEGSPRITNGSPKEIPHSVRDDMTGEERRTLKSYSSIIGAIARWFHQPVLTRPLAYLRAAGGFLAFAYFLRIFSEFRYLTSMVGLLDHDAVTRAFPFTYLPVISEWRCDALLLSITVAGLISSLLLAFGVLARISAATAYVAAVVLYRHNFAIMYVDDALIHLLLFWLMLSPIGNSCTPWNQTHPIYVSEGDPSLRSG